jgi:glycosyltransferase involved in cell wall biosynthesis
MHGSVNVLMFDSTSLDASRTQWKETLKAGITRGLFQKAFVSGRRSADYLLELGGRALPFEQGYDVVDNAYFATRVSEIRAMGHKDRSSSPFLFVGRLAAAKNLPLLLDGFGRYKLRGGRRSLDIVGHGPLEGSLRVATAQAGLTESVRFAGFQAYESLPDWYAQAGCLILPSESEPWGLVVNEAMASGLPVIVSDRCGCVDDLVEDGQNGYIFHAEESESLTEHMLALDALSEGDLVTMGDRSQQIIAAFSPDTWADAVVRLIRGRSECSTHT